MEKFTCILLFVFVFSVNLLANDKLPFTPEAQEKTLLPSLAVTVGYIPKPSVNALKTDIAFNNIVFDRAGAYTSFEKGLNSGFFTNIIGITGTVHKNVYLWGGIEFFTKNGLFHKDFERFGKTRKEFGIGVAPVKNIVVKGGWSKSVGVTFGAGLRIPI